MALKKKKPDKEPNHERWLVSYGDLLTLLFAVFVVLYAMSMSDKKKAEEVAASIREAFGTLNAGGAHRKPSVIDSGRTSIIPEIVHRSQSDPTRAASTGIKRVASEAEFKEIKASMDAFLLKSGAQGKVNVEINQRGLVVSLKEAGFFDSGSATIKKDMDPVIRSIADVLKMYSNRCRVEGHTDNIPIHSGQFESNWDLSSARATFLVKKLVTSYGIDPATVSATGYGEFQPVADNSTSEGRAINRRVDVVLLASEGEVAEPRSFTRGLKP